LAQHQVRWVRQNALTQVGFGGQVRKRKKVSGGLTVGPHEELGQPAILCGKEKENWEGWATRQDLAQEAERENKFVFIFSDLGFKRILFKFK
jgi:hypothetical protein